MLLASASLVLAAAGRAQSPEAASQFAPVDLEVIDVEATVAIASKAGERVPIVLIHDPGVALVVSGTFDEAFTGTRRDFLDRMEAQMGARVLDGAAVATQAFRDFRADFQAANTRFPVAPALAQTWARGFDGEPVRERIGRLLQAIERDQLIGQIRPASSIFVVDLGAAGPVRTWGEVAPRARAVDPSVVLTIPAAGELLRRTTDPLDRSAEGYLAGLLRSNVAEDAYLTGLLLGERLGEAAVRRTIVRGTRLTEDGRPLDAWAALALGQLGRLGIQPLDAPPSAAAPPASVAASQPELPATGAAAGGFALPPWVWLIAGIVICTTAAATILALVLARRRAAGGLMVMDRPGGSAAEGAVGHPVREWRERIVRALFTQRSVLLANEQAASRRVQEMEERLARLQPAIAEKIRGYEQRIEALEKEIAERDAETRDLLRAKLVLARKELEAEVARNRLTWN